MLDEATGTPRLQGVPTDPLGPVASSSTDTVPLPVASKGEADGKHVTPGEASVLIYCRRDRAVAWPVGDGHRCSRCGERVRVAW